MYNIVEAIKDNEVLAQQVEVMTDEGKYCSFKSIYGVVIKALESSEFITERHYFAALKKLGIVEMLGAQWSPPEEVRNRMIEEDLTSHKIYRRKKAVKDGYRYTYGFNCENKELFISEVLQPVVFELSVLEKQLAKVDNNMKNAKAQLKKVGLPIGLINPKGELDKEVQKWLRS